MRTLKLAGNVALVAVSLVVLGGCCRDQERTIGVLRIDNSELRKMLLGEQRDKGVLEERILSHQNDAKKLGDLIVSKDQTIQVLSDKVAMLDSSLKDRNAAYEALVAKLAGRPGPTGGKLPAVVGQLLKALQANYPGMLEFDEATGRLRFTSDVTFDLGSDTVKANAAEALRRMAAILNQDEAKPIRVDIVGHTCNTRIVKPATLARFPNNQALSEGRAGSVSKILIAGGVDAGRISTRGMGDTQPVAPNDTKANKARNRRVDVFLSMPVVPG